MIEAPSQGIVVVINVGLFSRGRAWSTLSAKVPVSLSKVYFS